VGRIAAISFLAAGAAQLLDPSDDVAGLITAVCVSGAVWIALALAFLRSDVTRAFGVARGLLPGAAR
jgi:uncharacterized membrane protein YhiD involved in acid resistance